MVVNTTAGVRELKDSFSLRRTALQRGISYFTTLRAAWAAAEGIAAQRGGPPAVRSLQEYHFKAPLTSN
jgi:carbamoyl-phosphate synthase large subunit